MDLSLLEQVAHFCESSIFRDRILPWRRKHLHLFEDAGKADDEQPLER